jgi:enoyl-CoA hydratase
MTLQMPETFKYEKRGKIAIMTVNRPEAMNAFTEEMLAAMDAAFEDFQKDDDLWVAILTGTGDKSFCSGMDLGEAIPKLNSGEQLGYEDHTKRPFSDVFKPIITAVNGFCIAGGMEFMQGTDIRIAAEHAIFGLGEVRFGVCGCLFNEGRVIFLVEHTERTVVLVRVRYPMQLSPLVLLVLQRRVEVCGR